MAKSWVIGDKHPDYGTVEMMGVTGGEAYRWLVSDDGVVSMIPLSVLNMPPVNQCDGCMAGQEIIAGDIHILSSGQTTMICQRAKYLSEDDGMCPNCVTPWKCNGPHVPEGD